jgi:hypothetical protein
MKDDISSIVAIETFLKAACPFVRQQVLASGTFSPQSPGYRFLCKLGVPRHLHEEYQTEFK